jgi:hypothetical protein
MSTARGGHGISISMATQSSGHGTRALHLQTAADQLVTMVIIRE